MRDVACLFVDPAGVYPTMLGTDNWCADRDARQYRGSMPVVAHPPCQLWGPFAAVNYARWGGEHNRPGNDGGCFESALNNVRRCGGVLEHPAFSKAWKEYGLTAPTGTGWTSNAPFFGTEWVCEVWQSAYGHKARKRTWLLYVSLTAPIELRWERPDGTHQIGFHDQRGKERNKPTLSGRAASATPPMFALNLLRLARASNLCSDCLGMAVYIDTCAHCGRNYAAERRSPQ